MSIIESSIPFISLCDSNNDPTYGDANQAELVLISGDGVGDFSFERNPCADENHTPFKRYAIPMAYIMDVLEEHFRNNPEEVEKMSEEYWKAM